MRTSLFLCLIYILSHGSKLVLLEGAHNWHLHQLVLMCLVSRVLVKISQVQILGLMDPQPHAVLRVILEEPPSLRVPLRSPRSGLRIAHPRLFLDDQQGANCVTVDKMSYF